MRTFFSAFLLCAPTRPRRTTPCEHIFPMRNVRAHAAHHDTREMRTRDRSCWRASARVSIARQLTRNCPEFHVKMCVGVSCLCAGV